MSAADCYRCAHRRDIPGDAHSRCVALGDSLLGAITARAIAESAVLLVLHPHGVSRGWCEWPLNFDPVWVSDCKLHKQLETPA